MYIFEIPSLFPTLNETSRMAHYSIKRVKQLWLKHLHNIMMVKGYRPKEPFKKAHIDIVRYSNKEPDYDNMVGGCKYLIDLFTTPQLQEHGHVKNKYGLGFIVDDSPEHLTASYRWEKCNPLNKKTVITIKGE